MGLSLCGATHKCSCLTDERVGVSQISVQRQRSLVLSNALSHTVRCTLDYPQRQMGKGVVRRVGQRLCQRRLGYCEVRGPIVGLKPGANYDMDGRHKDHRVDIVGIQR